MKSIFAKSFVVAELVCASLFAGQDIRLEARGSYLIASQVYVNGQGPFRFLVDTGAQSCAMRPQTAARLGVAVTGRVQHVSPVGTTISKVGLLQRVTVGPATVSDIDVLMTDLAAARQVDATIDGVLGQSFLEHFDYLLDYKRRRFVLDPEEVRGETVTFQLSDGLMAIDALALGETRKLVIDSGAPGLVLFGARGRGTERLVRVVTNSGEGLAVLTREKVRIGRWVSRPMTTALLPGSAVGLLPAAAFDAIYVNNREGYLVLNPRL